jgi:hypothetical protein
MCNCTSENLEIPDRRFASSGMTVEIGLWLNAAVVVTSQKKARFEAGLE